MRCQTYTLSDDYHNVILRSYHSLLSPQSREYREHHHTECEISVFLAGRGTYRVGDVSYEFQAGNVFLFGSNEAHCITEIYEDMDVLNLHFESKLLWEHTESVELLNIFAARSKGFCHRFEDPDGVLRRKLLELEREITEQNTCCALTAKYLLFSILVHMIRHYDCINPARAINSSSSTTKSLKKTLQYINENLGNRLTLKELADVACMTPTYFSSVFKKFNGVSPWEYITIKRVERAIDMLKTTDMTKLEIAEQCGFSSSSNFYKAFVHITGKKPNDFTEK